MAKRRGARGGMAPRISIPVAAAAHRGGNKLNAAARGAPRASACNGREEKP